MIVSCYITMTIAEQNYLIIRKSDNSIRHPIRILRYSIQNFNSYQIPHSKNRIRIRIQILVFEKFRSLNIRLFRIFGYHISNIVLDIGYPHIISNFGYSLFLRIKIYNFRKNYFDWIRISDISYIRMEFFNLSSLAADIWDLIRLLLDIGFGYQNLIGYQICQFSNIGYPIPLHVLNQISDFAHP